MKGTEWLVYSRMVPHKWRRHVPTYATAAEAESVARRCREVAPGWEVGVAPEGMKPPQAKRAA